MTLKQKQYVNLVRGKTGNKKNSQKIIFCKQTQEKLSLTKMELCGGGNAYRKGLYASMDWRDAFLCH